MCYLKVANTSGVGAVFIIMPKSLCTTLTSKINDLAQLIAKEKLSRLIDDANA